MSKKLNEAEVNDVNSWIEKLYKCQYIKEVNVKILCDKVKEIFLSE